MRIFDAEHRQYIRLGDLDHLLKSMRREVYDRYTRDKNGALYQEDGTKGLTHDDAVITATLAGVMTKVLKNKINACETPDEIRKVHERIEMEFYMDKFLVVSKENDETGKTTGIYFFMKYCRTAMENRMRDEGKTEDEIAEEMTEDAVGDPVFSTRLSDAEFFEDYEMADSCASFIRHNYGTDVEVVPAWHYDPNVEKRLIDWLNREVDGNG